MQRAFDPTGAARQAVLRAVLFRSPLLQEPLQLLGHAELKFTALRNVQSRDKCWSFWHLLVFGIAVSALCCVVAT